MKPRLLTIGIIVGVFIFGAVGGIWTQVFLMPYLSSHPRFQQWGFVRQLANWDARTTVIREVREIVIRTDDAAQRVAERAEGMVVGLESKNGEGHVIGGSGFALTSDGFILTLASVVPQGYTTHVYLRDGDTPIVAEVLKRDFKRDLAVIKVDERNLQTTGFATEDSLKVGAPIILVAKTIETGDLVTIVNQGTIRTKVKVGEPVRTNIFDKAALGGSPLLDLEGRIVGLSTFESSGRLVAIPASVLRAFSGF